MGRTVHYRTLERVSRLEFELLLDFIREINSRFCWSVEGLKLWNGFTSTNSDFVWGYTKVSNEVEANVVLDSIRKLSSELKGVAWLVLDEGIFEEIGFEFRDGELVGFRIWKV